MHQGQRRHGTRVLQVEVVLAHLIGQQQALVDHRAAAHAGHVVLAAVRQLERLDRGTGGLADDVELALQRIGHDHVGATADEDLPDHRLLGAHGRRHRHLRIHRHIAPPEQHLALGLDRARELLLAGQARRVLLGQEDHAHAVFARRWQFDALYRHLGAVELVGNLDQDAGAVAHQLVGADGATVVEVGQDAQALLDDAVGALALDVGHETDTAGIVFMRRAVQAMGRSGDERLGGRRWDGLRGRLGHGVLQRPIRGKARLLRRNNPDKQI